MLERQIRKDIGLGDGRRASRRDLPHNQCIMFSTINIMPIIIIIIVPIVYTNDHRPMVSRSPAPRVLHTPNGFGSSLGYRVGRRPFICPTLSKKKNLETRRAAKYVSSVAIISARTRAAMTHPNQMSHSAHGGLSRLGRPTEWGEGTQTVRSLFHVHHSTALYSKKMLRFVDNTGKRCPRSGAPALERPNTMPNTVGVELQLGPEAAAALHDPARRELVENLVSRLLHPRPGEDPLAGLIDRIKRKAQAAGLTDEIVDAELAAAKKSRRRASPRH